MPCERENKSISTADASIIKPIAKPQVGRRSKSYPVHAPDLRRITSFTLITFGAEPPVACPREIKYAVLKPDAS